MTSSKKYQIFVSSTFEDLKEERDKVFAVIYSMHHIPAGMEYFNSTDDSSWNLIKQIIDESDFYIVIVGHRYGSMDSRGVSFTEKEYNYAKLKKIPILSFVRDRDYPVSRQFVDAEANRQKLDKFIKKIKKKQCSSWKEKDDLAISVMASLNEAFEKYEMPGWVRGIDSLVKLTDNINKQRLNDITDINTDKKIAYALIENNIKILKEILKKSVYDGKDIPVGEIDKIIISIDKCTYEDLNKEKLKGLLEPAMVHSFLGDAINQIPAFQSFTKEYISFSENLKIILGLLKYKDNIFAQNLIQLITFSSIVIRWDTELTSILKTTAKDMLISMIQKESYKDIKQDTPFNMVHPVLRYYEIMHIVIKNIASLEDFLNSPTLTR